MWDIGGQESLRSSWNTYYSNTEVSNTFGTRPWHEGERRCCPAVGILAAGMLVQSTDGSRGRPSQRSAFHKGGRSEKQSEGQPPRCVGEESRGRGRCVKKSFLVPQPTDLTHSYLCHTNSKWRGTFSTRLTPTQTFTSKHRPTGPFTRSSTRVVPPICADGHWVGKSQLFVLFNLQTSAHIHAQTDKV